MKLHLSILTFITVIISSAADSTKTLTASVGGNVTLPSAVKERGFLLYERNTLAVIYENTLQILDDNYKKRLHWNQNTGFFTLTALQKSDSGIFTVELKKGTDISTDYNLIVYEPVEAPAVHTVNVSSESCSLLCSVDGAENTTLLWYKDQDVVKQRASTGPLLLTIRESDYSSSFRCVATNSAEHWSLVVDVETFCSKLKLKAETDAQSWFFLIPILLCWSFIVFWIILTNLEQKREETPTPPSHLKKAGINLQTQRRHMDPSPTHVFLHEEPPLT